MQRLIRVGKHVFDGLCHAAPPETPNTECGRPATWYGERPAPLWPRSFCDQCRQTSPEREEIISWHKMEGEAVPW